MSDVRFIVQVVVQIPLTGVHPTSFFGTFSIVLIIDHAAAVGIKCYLSSHYDDTNSVYRRRGYTRDPSRVSLLSGFCLLNISIMNLFYVPFLYLLA